MAKKQVTIRVPRNSLTAPSILDAVEQLAADGGEISIRAAAARLKCTPMALYRHFPDKQSLLLALLDRVLGRMKFERNFKLPDAQLLYLASQHLRILQQNPWAIPLLFQNPAPGNAANAIGENFLSLLGEAGISGKTAFRVLTSVLALNYGWAGFTPLSGTHTGKKPLEVAAEQVAPSSHEFPKTAQSWKYISMAGNEKDYAMAFSALLESGK